MNFTNQNQNCPSSFCTICTNKCKNELVLLLLTLSIHHNGAKVYIMCDKESKLVIDELTPNLNKQLKMTWFVELDKYSNKSRADMEKEKIWCEFQMMKANVMKKTLEREKDTLFLDSDIVILDKINDINHNKSLGVSPQFIKDKNVKEVGYYNGGMIWTNNKQVPLDWIEFTKTSRYFDQASIEDLVKKYKHFEFGENYNLQTWRFILGKEDSKTVTSNIKIANTGKLYYKNAPLKCIHTHFKEDRFKEINNLFMLRMAQARYYKELTCIYRSMNGKWIIKMPTQPRDGIWNHNNDSFRELAMLYKQTIKDVDLFMDKESGHCWLVPQIILYDRPTMEWINEECRSSGLFLLGNGNEDKEGVELRKLAINAKPWIFWPRRPSIVEQKLKENKILEWSERNCETIFIGNIENNIQNTYRDDSNLGWEDVLEEYHCTKGKTHKFTQEEYLDKIRKSKYGLCLRGYGSKCHREMECMAFGTVPIITPKVSIKSFINPPSEGIHYIRAHNPDDLRRKLKNIKEKRWISMSKAAAKWYMENVHSSGSWDTTIKSVLYKY
jgi:hypothetical protein